MHSMLTPAKLAITPAFSTASPVSLSTRLSSPSMAFTFFGIAMGTATVSLLKKTLAEASS